MRKAFTMFFLFILTVGYLADSKDSVNVGPGMVLYKEYRAAGPWRFNVLKIDLTNPYIKLQSVKANDRLFAFEKTSSMATRKNAPGNTVVGAINADFYNTSTGEPVSTQIIGGEILKGTNSRNIMAFDVNKKPLLSAVSLSSPRVFAGDSSKVISGVNKARETDNLILYNSYYGANTGAGSEGVEAEVIPIGDWLINDTITCVVARYIDGAPGSMSLSKGKAVLSGHGASATWLRNNVALGDTLKLFIRVTPTAFKFDQAVGGNQRLITNGANVAGTDDRHPRTSVGISEDSTTLYLFTVDGRQTGYSIGMDLIELANYMLEWNVYQGINLDGGGSTTMWVRGAIQNSPSDIGGERSVANGFLVVSTAPNDTLYEVRISPKKEYVIGGTDVQFSVTGYDRFYNPHSITSYAKNWSCDTSIGTITSNGLLTGKLGGDSGYVRVEVNGIKDSALVYITQVTTIIVTPDPVILKVGEIQQMQAEAYDQYDNKVALSNNAFTWSVTDTVGTISISGLFSGTGYGIGEIIAEYNGVQGSVSVTVGYAAVVMIDDFSDFTKYTLTGAKVNLAQCSFTGDSLIYISPPTSGKLTYSFTGQTGTSALYVNCSTPFSGTPEKISLYVYGDGAGHWLRGEFADVDGERFICDFTAATPGIDWNGEWRSIDVYFADAVPKWSNPSAVLTFPLTWKIIYLAETKDDNKNDGVIYFDNFQVHFVEVGIDDIASNIPDKFSVEPNYPNPFNPSTNIRFHTPEVSKVNITIYDFLGRKVTVLADGQFEPGIHTVKFDGTNLSSGVYFCVIKANDFNKTIKLSLIK